MFTTGISSKTLNTAFIKQKTVQEDIKKATPFNSNIKTDFKEWNIPSTNAYMVSFEGYKLTPNEIAFKTFKDAFCKKFHLIETAYNDKQWTFDTHSTPENEEKCKQAKKDFLELYVDEEKLNQLNLFQQTGIQKPALKRHFDFIFKQYDLSTKHKEDLNNLNNLEIETSNKANNITMDIDGKPYSYDDLTDLIYSSSTPVKPEFIKEVKGLADKRGQLVIDLVKKRNEFAQKLGYKNYYEYKIIDEYNLKPDEYNKQMEKLFDSAALINQKWKVFANKFPDKILQESELDKLIEDKDLMELSKSHFKDLGFDITSMPIVYDLFPRHSKVGGAYCWLIDKGKETPNRDNIRILGNLKNDYDGWSSLNHELGHGCYSALFGKHLNILDKDHPSTCLTEAIAFLTQYLPLREPQILENKLGFDKTNNERLKNYYNKEKVNFIVWQSMFNQIEKTLYENDDKDVSFFTEKWKELSLKGLGYTPYFNDNYWATVEHFISSPVYIHSYLQATALESQLYKSLRDQVGGNLSEHPEIAKILTDKIFKYGKSKTEEELVLNLTSSKTNVNDLIAEITNNSPIIQEET